MQRLEHAYHTEFEAAPSVQWKLGKGEGIGAGVVRAAGVGAGNVTFARVFDAGYGFSSP